MCAGLPGYWRLACERARHLPPLAGYAGQLTVNGLRCEHRGQPRLTDDVERGFGAQSDCLGDLHTVDRLLRPCRHGVTVPAYRGRVADLPGSGDCEARIATWGQPVLFASSAAYIVTALFVLWWASRHTSRNAPLAAGQVWAFAIGLVAAGLGSMDYHGPALGPEPLLHDAGLALALIAAVSIDLSQLGVWPRLRTPVLVALTVGAIAIIAVVPTISPALAAVAAVGLIITEITVYRRGLRTLRPALFAGCAALGLGAVIFAASRTGGPLCDPESLLQGHAVWHLLTASALGLWLVTALPDNVRGGEEPA